MLYFQILFAFWRNVGKYFKLFSENFKKKKLKKINRKIPYKQPLFSICYGGISCISEALESS